MYSFAQVDIVVRQRDQISTAKSPDQRDMKAGLSDYSPVDPKVNDWLSRFGNFFSPVSKACELHLS